MRFVTAIFLSLGLAGCGPAFRAEFDFSSATAPKLLAYDCALSRAYNVIPTSPFSWEATKTSGEVVTGHHQVAGTFVGGPNDLTGAQMKIDFLANTLSTGVELRDSRIKDNVFNVDVGLGVTFEMTGINWVSGAMNFPGPGEVSVYSVSGNLNVGGITSPLSFEIRVIGDSSGLVVTPAQADGLVIDVRNTLGLTGPIADLLMLVPGVEMQDTVRFKFQLHMVPGC